MKKETIDKIKSFLCDIIEFLIENKRYAVSSVLVVIIVLFIVSSDDKNIRIFPKLKAKKKVVKEVKNKEVEEKTEVKDENPLILNEDKELNKFIKKYYKALEKADIEKIRKYVDVLSDAEVDIIKNKAKSREAHENIKVYTKKGPEEDSLLVYVYLDLKFKNIKTMAPGIEPYYIKKEADGYLIINSQNSKGKDLEYTNEAGVSEDVVELYARADDAYREACSKDKELVKMLKENGLNVPDLSDDKKDEEKKDNASSDKKDTDTKKDESKKDESKKEEKDKKKVEKPTEKKKDKKEKKKKKGKGLVGKTYILTDSISLREKKSKSSESKVTGVKDDRVKILKEYKKNPWVKVELNAAGQTFTGYMKKDVLLKNSKLKK